VLLSSLAECVYWFGRYIERTENTARMILVNDSLLLDVPPHCNPGWAPIIHISGSAPQFYRHYDDASEHNVVRYLVMDGDNNPGAMINSTASARENLRTARALFPKPLWEVVNDLHGYLKDNPSAVLSHKRRYRFLRNVIDACHLIAGKLAATMSHDDIYEFVRIGFNLERADMTSRVIDVRAENLLKTSGNGLQPFDDIQWKSVLDSLAAWQMYRRCVHVRISGGEVLRYLLKDGHFPRAIYHCLVQLEQSLYALAVTDTPRTALLEARRMVRHANIESIVSDGLHEFIDDLQLLFTAIHNELSRHYFEGREIAAVKANDEPTRIEAADDAQKSAYAGDAGVRKPKKAS
jgi:uncharacterized alpha-E superfamily protein